MHNPCYSMGIQQNKVLIIITLYAWEHTGQCGKLCHVLPCNWYENTGPHQWLIIIIKKKTELEIINAVFYFSFMYILYYIPIFLAIKPYYKFS